MNPNGPEHSRMSQKGPRTSLADLNPTACLYLHGLLRQLTLAYMPLWSETDDATLAARRALHAKLVNKGVLLEATNAVRKLKSATDAEASRTKPPASHTDGAHAPTEEGGAEEDDDEVFDVTEERGREKHTRQQAETVDLDDPAEDAMQGQGENLGYQLPLHAAPISGAVKVKAEAKVEQCS